MIVAAVDAPRLHDCVSRASGTRVAVVAGACEKECDRARGNNRAALTSCVVSDPSVDGGKPFQSDCSTVTAESENATDEEAQTAVANAGAAQNMGLYYAT